MTSALATVRQLVEDFKAQEGAFLSPDYQESRVRQDFIDKFFTALGWDVTHERQKNPYEQEVKIENKVKTQSSQRRADYAFFIAPNFRDVKFFAEAKKPHHDLANPEYYHQAIRYGWNQRTPIAVLTDFEEFHILDCRYKPDMKTALDRKIQVFHYADYADEEKFARIFYLFGRDAVAAGSIEKFAGELPKPRGKAALQVTKRGYQAVDEAFLEALDGYRDTLARTFKNNNPALDGDELTEAVQRTLDRLVFIRFLEDKQIEEEEIRHLRPHPRQTDGGLADPALGKGRVREGSAWSKFRSLCRTLEPKYNGLIFKPHRIIDSDDFVPPDDDQFADICDELADPTSPYDFDKIPISILGSIYERFLGKVVRATDKRAKVEEKPEVRKAGGVYYTPEYIVRYIVKETVGKLIEGKTPDQIAAMAFADIACGSGSFLLEVYSTLLDYHTRWYNEHPDYALRASSGRTQKAKKGDVEERDGRLVLSLKKTQAILTNNIYGVDIDFQATEVTQLSLYLRLLEDVTLTQLHLFKEKVLPDLRKNIVCGNSLIEPDIETQPSLFESNTPSPHKTQSEPRGGTGRGQTPDLTDHLKPMRFTDAFPDVMTHGGFDAIVGNPPYGATIGTYERPYFAKRFKVFAGAKDVYSCFLEKAIDSLHAAGTLSYIVPSAWVGGPEYLPLRSILLENQILKVVLLPFDVFADAYVDTLIVVVQKSIAPANHVVKTFSYGKRDKLATISLLTSDYSEVSQKQWADSKDKKFILRASTIDLLQKIKERTNSSFDYVIAMKRGVLFDKGLLTDRKTSDKSYRYFEGDVYRYQLNIRLKKWIEFDDRMSERPKEFTWFEGRRILLRRLVNRQQRLMASYTEQTFITNKNLYTLTTNRNIVEPKFILGLANSRLISHLYINQVTQATKDDFPQVTIKDFVALPFPSIDFSDPADKARRDHIVSLVEQMLAAKEKLAAVKTDAEVSRLEMQCESLDRQIDDAVYELYGLTKEEISLIESGEVNG
jgi:type I restriction-modification system DNA methylase subunit